MMTFYAYELARVKKDPGCCMKRHWPGVKRPWGTGEYERG